MKRKKARSGRRTIREDSPILPLVNTLRYLEKIRAYEAKPVDTVNHLHDKPIEMAAGTSHHRPEIVRKVRGLKTMSAVANPLADIQMNWRNSSTISSAL